jgi:branched-chain amino acid transport system ATP-binding protein
MTPILEVENLRAGFGRHMVLHGIGLRLDSGEALGLLGPNGHGKTTLLRCVSGLHRPQSGDIRFEGQSLLGRSPRAILRKGIVHVPQGSKLFPNMSVADCLRLGSNATPARAKDGAALRAIFDLFPRLEERKQQLSGTLSGGERQMLSIGIGLMSRPRLLILDEPGLGLAPKVKHEVADAIQKLRTQMEALVLVDGDLELVLERTDRFAVIESGRVVERGSSADGKKTDRMMTLFLGEA